LKLGSHEVEKEESTNKEVPFESRTKNVTALIVDDNAINRKVIEKLTTLIGFESSTAISGEEAIQLVSRALPNSIDVIFMDIFMPGTFVCSF
jgi:CheY-like chemotaxis protein